SQKVINWNSEGLTLNVPHGNVDRSQRGCENNVAAVERMLVDCLPVVCRPARVLADKIGLDFLDGGDHGGDAPLHGALADAGDTGVCVHLDEDAAQRVDRYDLESGYLDLVARVGQSAAVVDRLRGKVALAREQAAQAHGGGFHPGAA